MQAYAILETGGKQTLVKVGDKIEIEKLSVEVGTDVDLDTVCAVSDGTRSRLVLLMSKALRLRLPSTVRSAARRLSTSR